MIAIQEGIPLAPAKLALSAHRKNKLARDMNLDNLYRRGVVNGACAKFKMTELIKPRLPPNSAPVISKLHLKDPTMQVRIDLSVSVCMRWNYCTYAHSHSFFCLLVLASLTTSHPPLQTLDFAKCVSYHFASIRSGEYYVSVTFNDQMVLDSFFVSLAQLRAMQLRLDEEFTPVAACESAQKGGLKMTSMQEDAAEAVGSGVMSAADTVVVSAKVRPTLDLMETQRTKTTFNVASLMDLILKELLVKERLVGLVQADTRMF